MQISIKTMRVGNPAQEHFELPLLNGTECREQRLVVFLGHAAELP
jgi:hypothetical protein